MEGHLPYSITVPTNPISAMSNNGPAASPAQIEPELREMKIEEGTQSELESADRIKLEYSLGTSVTPKDGASPSHKLKSTSRTQSPAKMESRSQSPADESRHEEVVGGDIALKQERGKAPKLSRTASEKMVHREPPLYLDVADSTSEATSSFQLIEDCIYSNKWLGFTEQALECDCAVEWGMLIRLPDHCCMPPNH